MGYVLLVPIAWAGGVAVYLLTYLLFFGQMIGKWDLLAVVFSSGWAFGLCAPTIYYPGLFWLRRAQGGCKRLALFALLPAILGVLPATMASLACGGSPPWGPFPKSVLFLGLFAGAGVVYGLGFVYVSNLSSA